MQYWACNRRVTGSVGACGGIDGYLRTGPHHLPRTMFLLRSTNMLLCVIFPGPLLGRCFTLRACSFESELSSKNKEQATLTRQRLQLEKEHKQLQKQQDKKVSAAPPVSDQLIVLLILVLNACSPFQGSGPELLCPFTNLCTCCLLHTQLATPSPHCNNLTAPPSPPHPLPYILRRTLRVCGCMRR